MMMNKVKKKFNPKLAFFSNGDCLSSNIAKNKLLLIPAVLFFTSLIFYSYNLEGQPWHGDELFFNSGGGVYFNLLLNNDLSNPCWNGLGKCELLHNFNWEWPVHSSHIRHIFIGLSQYLSNQTDNDYLVWSSWHHDFWNAEYTPTPKEFAAGRLLSPIFGSLTIVVVFFIGNLLFNRFVGTTFSLLLLFHPLWFYNSRLAMTEVYVGFFLSLSILCIFYFIKSNNRIKYLVLGGFLFGVSFNVKYSTLPLAVFPLLLIWGKEFFCNKSKITKKNALKSFYLCSIFLGVFLTTIFLTNPYFYPGPISQLSDLLLGSQVDFREVTLPTLEHDNLFRMLAAFHSSIMPYSVNYYDFNSYEDGQLHLSWDLPYTYSTIPISLFFFIGMGFLIIQIITKKARLSEYLILCWFLITFFEIFLTVRVFWAERFFVPLIFPIISISSYGIWKCSKYITPSKIKLLFCGFVISSSAISTLVFYNYFYNSSGKYIERFTDGTIQSVVSRVDTFFLMLSFILTTLCVVYYFILKIKISSKKKRIFVMILISMSFLVFLLPNTNEEIIARSTFEKTFDVEKEIIFSTIANVEKYPEIFNGKVKSVIILNQTENIIYSKNTFQHDNIETELTIKHSLIPYNSQIIEIVEGDAKGTILNLTFEENNNSTKIIVDTEIHLTGILKPIGLALQLSNNVMEKTTNKILNQFVNYVTTNPT
jgi:hypothetical protein